MLPRAHPTAVVPDRSAQPRSFDFPCRNEFRDWRIASVVRDIPAEIGYLARGWGWRELMLR